MDIFLNSGEVAKLVSPILDADPNTHIVAAILRGLSKMAKQDLEGCFWLFRTVEVRKGGELVALQDRATFNMTMPPDPQTIFSVLWFAIETNFNPTGLVSNLSDDTTETSPAEVSER
jgi:hypothetical protein